MSETVPSKPAPTRRLTLADRVVPRSAVTDALLVVAGAGLISIFAYIAFPLWPVSVTMQSMAVLLIGAAFGVRRGMISVGAYVVLGLVGVPVFSGGNSGSLLDLPTGGYIVGFILAAGVVGVLQQRTSKPTYWSTVGAFGLGTVVIYAAGLPWLAASLFARGDTVWRDTLGFDSLFEATLSSGLYPFIFGDILKASAAAAIVVLTSRAVDRMNAQADLDALLP